MSIQTTFGECSFEQFKQRAAHFFREAKDASQEQIDAGFKTLAISYFGLSEHCTELELYQAGILINKAAQLSEQSSAIIEQSAKFNE